jgi:hypothetical protein
LPSRRTPIKYPSRIEKVKEKNKTQKMYFSQSISQIDRETISYSNSIFPNLTLSQTIIILPEHQGQSGGMVYLLPVGI